MYPHERSLVKNFADKPFTIIGVNSDKSIDIPQQLAADGTVTWRSFQNQGPATPISTSWGVRGWPTTYLIDAQGVIRYSGLRGEKIDQAVQLLLEEMGE